MDFFHHRYYRTNKIFMSIMGQWPFQTTRSSRRLLAILLFLCISQTVPQVLAFVKFRNNKVLLMESAGPLLFAIATFVKIIHCICFSRQMAEMLNSIRTHWDVWSADEEVKFLHKYAKEGRKMTIMYAVAISLTGVVFITQPIMPTIIGVFLKNHSEPGEFPFPVDYYNLDTQKYYIYIIMHTYVCVSAGLLVTIASDTMFIVYVQHGCGIFSALGHKIQEIKKHESTNTVKNVYVSNKRDESFKQLSLCIDRHNDAIKYAELLEATYSWYLFFNAGFAMIGVSLSGLQAVDNTTGQREMARHIITVLANMIHLYMENYLSQMLTDHSISIRYYIHNGNWFTLPLDDQRLLRFMIMRCNMSCNLTAGKMSILSVETFSVILKTSLSYFTLLRSI